MKVEHLVFLFITYQGNTYRHNFIYLFAASYRQQHLFSLNHAWIYGTTLLRSYKFGG